MDKIKLPEAINTQQQISQQRLEESYAENNPKEDRQNAIDDVPSNRLDCLTCSKEGFNFSCDHNYGHQAFGMDDVQQLKQKCSNTYAQWQVTMAMIEKMKVVQEPIIEEIQCSNSQLSEDQMIEEKTQNAQVKEKQPSHQDPFYPNDQKKQEVDDPNDFLGSFYKKQEISLPKKKSDICQNAVYDVFNHIETVKSNSKERVVACAKKWYLTYEQMKDYIPLDQQGKRPKNVSYKLLNQYLIPSGNQDPLANLKKATIYFIVYYLQNDYPNYIKYQSVKMKDNIESQERHQKAANYLVEKYGRYI